MQRFISQHGYTGRVPAATLVERLRSALLAASPGRDGRSFGVLALMDQVALLNRQLSAFGERIAEVFARHPNAALFGSLPGTGPMVAANLLAEIGEDRARFPAVVTLPAEAGSAEPTIPGCGIPSNRWGYSLKRSSSIPRAGTLPGGSGPRSTCPSRSGRRGRVLAPYSLARLAGRDSLRSKSPSGRLKPLVSV